MAYFIIETVLFFLGLFAFFHGWIPLTRRRSVNGAAARVAGAILMIPLPLYLIACEQSHLSPLGYPTDELDPLMPETEGFVHLSAILAALGSFLAASVLSITASEKKPRP
jgi:hypothetical protein